MILDSLDLVAHGELKLKVKDRGSLHSIIRCTRVPPDASYRSLGMSRTRHIYLIYHPNLFVNGENECLLSYVAC